MYVHVCTCVDLYVCVCMCACVYVCVCVFVFATEKEKEKNEKRETTEKRGENLLVPGRKRERKIEEGERARKMEGEREKGEKTCI